MKRIAKISLMALAALGVFGLAGRVSATPPKKLYVDYNPTSQTLKVIIIHPVGNPGRHHIKLVRVTRGDEQIAEMTQARQTGKSFDLVIFQLKNVRPGQTLTAKAWCNYFGSKSVALDIEEKKIEEARKAFREQEKDLNLGRTFDEMYKRMMEAKKPHFPVE